MQLLALAAGHGVVDQGVEVQLLLLVREQGAEHLARRALALQGHGRVHATGPGARLQQAQLVAGPGSDLRRQGLHEPGAIGLLLEQVVLHASALRGDDPADAVRERDVGRIRTQVGLDDAHPPVLAGLDQHSRASARGRGACGDKRHLHSDGLRVSGLRVVDEDTRAILQEGLVQRGQLSAAQCVVLGGQEHVLLRQRAEQLCYSGLHLGAPGHGQRQRTADERLVRPARSGKLGRQRAVHKNQACMILALLGLFQEGRHGLAEDVLRGRRQRRQGRIIEQRLQVTVLPRLLISRRRPQLPQCHQPPLRERCVQTATTAGRGLADLALHPFLD
mmetsp:Transcript_107601/g.273138  ORF Transcript_107601/g.273138 Transcript_107601/m.273138 type:complete len:333 (+) Transcript_107601:412-1410(+)